MIDKSTRVWYGIISSTLGSIVGLGIIALLLNGVFNSAQLTASQEHSLPTELQSPVRLAPEIVLTYPASLPINNQSFSITLESQFSADSDPLASVGIWFRDVQNQQVIIAINGAQYVTARQCRASVKTIEDLLECRPLTEPNQQILTFWKHFRHLNPAGQRNRIHLEYHPETSTGLLTIRLNQEWMWDIPFNPAPSGEWSIWITGGMTQPSVLQWHTGTVRLET